MSGGFDPGKVDDVIHGRLRLGVMAYLSSVRSALFTELAEALEATNGNLSVALRKLEEAGYVAIDKRFENRKPRTSASLTEEGRRAWAAYLENLQGLFPKG
ncbi:winged helix-turn-helix domain-containing protein [Parvularcula maris]|uniref:Transcriptional regulator n=1 Tax=Parvularcula maris TaxID=2965077 RepID=A0A9X2RHG1_9PROT|nr:transcriptional regulator [Parvularcula maris]MCQ8184844.1 transcriptional regulator [Parvularcula maris]